MSSSVSFVRRRNVLNACEILINFLACVISYLSISARDLKPDQKHCYLRIKHYINATTFKIIQLDARKRALGQLAMPTGKAPRLNFSLPECFSKELEYWCKGFAISNFLNFLFSPTFSQRWLDIVF